MPRWAASSFILLPLGCFLSPDTQAFAGARRALSEKILELRLGLQVPPSVKDGLFKNDSPTNFLVIGNSGVGKSAILNCLIGDEGVLFPSGISMCEGMTKGCCPQRRDQHRFIDTPGMGDPSIPPERTADEITMALKFDGRYKVIFVLTLEHGRLDAGQLATMKLVLDAAPIKKYGVLLNQLTGPVYEKLSQKHEFERLIEIINMNMPKGKTARNPRFVQLMHEDLLLRDATNKVVNLPEEVVRFIQAVPGVHLAKKRVEAVRTNLWDKEKQAMQTRLQKIDDRLSWVRMWVVRISFAVLVKSGLRRLRRKLDPFY
ncbi:unnamed protein product [Symbiodinium natans]|uniref:AIG1-type G domain-containing protein n=1 Tax=Symbiodinium natans TaxID=878477 RepID=A0A812P6F3_9DINO|nr:unnamed protein product [Symbiodinium natans]